MRINIITGKEVLHSSESVCRWSSNKKVTAHYMDSDRQWPTSSSGYRENHYYMEISKMYSTNALFFDITVTTKFYLASTIGMSNNKINSSDVEMYRLCTFTKRTRPRVHITSKGFHFVFKGIWRGSKVVWKNWRRNPLQGWGKCGDVWFSVASWYKQTDSNGKFAPIKIWLLWCHNENWIFLQDLMGKECINRCLQKVM